MYSHTHSLFFLSHTHTSSPTHLCFFLFFSHSLFIIKRKILPLKLLKETSKYRKLLCRPGPIWLTECSSTDLTPQRWYTAVLMVHRTLTLQTCYRDNRGCFWYPFWKTLTVQCLDRNWDPVVFIPVTRSGGSVAGGTEVI